MIVPNETPRKGYSPRAFRASWWFLIFLFVASWAVYFLVAASDGAWPSPVLPLGMTTAVIYGIVRNRRR